MKKKKVNKNYHGKKLNVVSFFSGIGSFEEALERIGIPHEIKAFSEIDKWAVTSYCAIHGVDKERNMGDITKIHPTDVPNADIITHGSPCFRAGTFITTDEGLKKIEDIKIGDNVLTHKNRFKKVVTPMINSTKDIFKLRIQGSPITFVTKEHPYYVRKMKRVWNGEKRTYERVFSEPEWVEAKDLEKGCFVGFGINKNSINSMDITKEEAWLLGRYVADGYLQNGKRADRINSYNNKVTFCIGKDKLERFKENVSEYYIGISEERTAYKCRIINKRFMDLCLECGRGSVNKRIPQFIMDLPIDILKEFLDGYISGDGSSSKDVYKATSISKELIYQLGQVVNKVYQVPYSIHYTERPKTTIIEGRTVNQMDTWTITFRGKIKKQTHAIVIDGMLWSPFKQKTLIEDVNEKVYNFEVEDDNSYVANNCTVHNCQDFSVAGKGKGGDIGTETRSSLMWHTVNIIEHKRPKYVIWENVKGVLSAKHKHNFDNYLNEMERIGYNNYYEVLNAKNYGIPQNRERIFVISIRKDIDNGRFKFPEPFDNGLRLKHMLEDSVDEKYYINKERCEKLLEELKEKETHKSLERKLSIEEQLVSCLGNVNPSKRGMNGNVYGCNISPTLTTNKGEGIKILQINNPKHFSQRVYSKEGLAPTISAGNNGGGKEPCKILEEYIEVRACLTPERKEKRQNGRQFKENGEPMFTLTANDRHGVIIKNCNEPRVLRSERNEYGKFIRKRYEAGEIDEKMSNMRTVAPREDGISNTLTSVLKDNLILEPNKCKQVLTIPKDILNDNERQRRVYSPEGISPTVLSRTDNAKILQVGMLDMKGSEQVRRVYNPEGIAPTLDTMQGGHREPKIICETQNEIQMIEIEQLVRVRKHEVDEKTLVELLRKHKKDSKLTNRQLSEKLNRPITLVEHWFRKDSSFSIPDEYIWYDLKDLLEIKTDEFDLPVTEFIEKEGVYEKGNRFYHEDGVAPTLTTSGNERIIQESNNLQFVGGIGNKDWAGDGKELSRNYPQGDRVYSMDGLACSQTSQGGGTGSYTGLYLEKPSITVHESIKPSVAKNFEREKEEILNSDKEIYQCKCDGGWQDNKVGLKVSPTLRAGNSHTATLDNHYRIRKLTPLECWRLMGFTDYDYFTAKAALEKEYYKGNDRSNSQMYKQAGNSIVVNVLECIFKSLFLN